MLTNRNRNEKHGDSHDFYDLSNSLKSKMGRRRCYPRRYIPLLVYIIMGFVFGLIVNYGIQVTFLNEFLDDEDDSLILGVPGEAGVAVNSVQRLMPVKDNDAKIKDNEEPKNPAKTDVPDYDEFIIPEDVNDTFIPVNNDRMSTFHNLCFESGTEFTKLVVYTDDPDADQGEQQIAFFNVTFKHGKPPKKFKMISDTAAYFIMTKYAYNVYHFIDNALIPLFGMLEASNRLLAKVPNHLFYRQLFHEVIRNEKAKFAGVELYEGPLDDIPNDFFFQELLTKVHVTKDHHSYPIAPTGVCYKNVLMQNNPVGVMPGSEPYRVEERYRWAKHFLKLYGISPKSCPKHVNTTVAIIQRRTNRILLNVKDLENRAIHKYFETSVVFLEDMTIRQQILTAYCNDIIVGVTGAGLYWSLFYKNTRVLIEISWPDAKWNKFFPSLFKHDPNFFIFPITVDSDHVFFGDQPARLVLKKSASNIAGKKGNVLISPTIFGDVLTKARAHVNANKKKLIHDKMWVE